MGLTWEEAEVAALNRSECGPMHPLRCGMNQDQGQQLHIFTLFDKICHALLVKSATLLR